MPGFRIPTNVCKVENDGGDGPSNVAEYARKHRFRLEVMEPMGDRRNGLLLYLEKCTRPTIEIDQIMIHNGQDEIPRPGKQHWKPVEFSFYEKLSDSENPTNLTASRIYRWWADSRTSVVDVRRSRQNAPSAYLKNVQLDLIDGNNTQIWMYYLYDAWPSKISPSDLSYHDSELSEITVTLSYSKAREGTDRTLGTL